MQMVKELLEVGADSICIKDMAGLISPVDASDLVTRLKAVTDVPIAMHCHYTSGMASMAYFEAAQAGIDVVDCAISSMSLGTSQPPTETIVAALAGTYRATGLDLAKLSEIGKYFAKVRKKYAHLEMNTFGVDTDVLQFQIPGGMISNLLQPVARAGSRSDKLPEVLEEVPRVRAELGYPPLVTPSSQIVGTQSVLNVLLGERYKMVPKEVKNVVKGMYGRTPAPIDPEVKKLVLGDEEPITVPARPICWSPSLRRLRPRLGTWPRARRTFSPTCCSLQWPRSSWPTAARRSRRSSAWTSWQPSPRRLAPGSHELHPSRFGAGPPLAGRGPASQWHSRSGTYRKIGEG